jgi:pyruvate/2-oxoglutarate dehydrogenase complex dihydrolipoamide acyltransferase (E2) component
LRNLKLLAVVACLAVLSVGNGSADEFIYYRSKRVSAPTATPVRAGAPVPAPAAVPSAPAGEQHSPPTLKQRFGPFQRSQRDSRHNAKAGAPRHRGAVVAYGTDAHLVPQSGRFGAPQITLVRSGKPLTYREAELAAREVADRENAAAAERTRLRQARQ